ncbi:MAG: tRNA (adenosine(37)-N6)-dimethylallyltransferase MiaA [Gemmatimonas sp.]
MSPVNDGTPTVLNVITGPTAAGKSSIAMALARRFNLAIISADSRQIYRGFDIGTAKPSADDRRDIPHFGVDVLDPEVRYSAHAWASDANAWLQQAVSDGKAPIVVGGTGFYVRALVRPLAPAPALDEDRRKRLERWLAQQDFTLLQRWCTVLDPARSGLGRTQLARAIETALLAGTRLGDVHAQHAHDEQDINAPHKCAGMWQVRYLVVDPGLPLSDRIRLRVDEMMAAGWEREIEKLMQTVSEDAPAWLASGYGVMRDHVRGLLTRDQATERVVIETRQYAKRQRTWCRHQLTEGPVTRISSLDPDVVDHAVHWLNGTESRT